MNQPKIISSPEGKPAHTSVGAIIENNGKYLLLDRSKQPWGFACAAGHIDEGEDPETALKREVKEETGIEVKDLKIISITQEMVEDAHFITIGFLCGGFEGEAQVMEPDEITEWKWFGLDELPKNMYKPSRKVIENYLAGKIYQKDL